MEYLSELEARFVDHAEEVGAPAGLDTHISRTSSPSLSTTNDYPFND